MLKIIYTHTCMYETYKLNPFPFSHVHEIRNDCAGKECMASFQFMNTACFSHVKTNEVLVRENFPQINN